MTPVRAELESCGATTTEVTTLFTHVKAFAHDGKPTSAGRYVSSLADAELELAIRQGFYGSFNLADDRILARLRSRTDTAAVSVSVEGYGPAERHRRRRLDLAEGRKTI